MTFDYALKEEAMTPEQASAHAELCRALDHQVGGNHYRNMPIQPVEYIHRNGIGFIEGAVIKYVSRWRGKGGIEDLKKAKHMLELLIDLETNAPQPSKSAHS